MRSIDVVKKEARKSNVESKATRWRKTCSCLETSADGTAPPPTGEIEEIVARGMRHHSRSAAAVMSLQWACAVILAPLTSAHVLPRAWTPRMTMQPYRRDPADAAELTLDEAELTKLLALRSEARLQRDFVKADAILDQLRSKKIDVNDRTFEWRAGYSVGTVASSKGWASGADPELEYSGDPEIARQLGSALLTQWRGDGRRRGQTWTHGFHPSKALMEPLCVSQLLELLPGSGAVLDPFAGSGTTMIEAMVAGRAAVGCDLSPLSVGVARQHCWRPSRSTLDELRSVIADDVVAALEREEEAMEDTVEIARAKILVAEALDAAGASAEVAAAAWFLLSFEELYVWPSWRKVRQPIP